ncbi:chemotaxis protein [Marinobacter sp. M-5]|uniref:chemotaxis protein n=1 Tax=Marinobacter sp. M-5 TaxID=3081089 RepID=UPI00293CBF32|nr:chemotaxis protein [Marinobacter sp. M-5]MDV3504198.1 chemotaxis protein [Marinobacter sp. M-5]
MSSVLASVDERTNLAGQNRLEMLLFGLGTNQVYGINVFKIREVIRCPELSEVPGGSKNIRGISHLRGETVPIIDLAESIGRAPYTGNDGFVIVTEYNRNIQGFLVEKVDRIVNLNWSEISPPPETLGTNHYLTGVVQLNQALVDIIDVEKVFAEISNIETDVSPTLKSTVTAEALSAITILAVDDSSVARNQVKKALEHLGFQVETAKDGQDALKQLTEKAEKLGDDFYTAMPLVVSDIEMPVMDGYTLTSEIRSRSELNKLHVVLHSSLSGQFNESMIRKVSADGFIAKFSPDDLSKKVLEILSIR